MKNAKWTVTALAAVSLLPLLLLAGCASGGAKAPEVPAGPTDEELVTDLINNMIDALQAKDIDAMGAAYAEDFQSNQGTDKAQTLDFLKSVKDQGFLDGMEVDSTNLAIAVDGDTATANGVEVRGAFGVLALSFKAEKRDGTWLVTYQAQE